MQREPNRADVDAIRAHLAGLQDQICGALEEEDGGGRFRREELEGAEGGVHRPRVLEGGAVLERAAVHLSHTVGKDMPRAASERRPELAGRSYEALSISLIVHPRNPYAPTSHANFRFFVARRAGEESAWWFGGGFDLTPYYGFEEDVRHWHSVARDACRPHGPEVYPRLKEWCDRYFHLPHRGEPRGVGGLFFDDWKEGGFERSLAFWKDVSSAYLAAYRPILARRKDTPYGERERAWQLVRRGRYVEFNLLYDRGTRFGLEAGGRTESILASMPPEVRWRYDHQPEPGSAEARLLEEFLRPRDWLAQD